MSMSSARDLQPEQTPFEKLWFTPGEHLFKSPRHGVMALPDAYPRMPLQVVVAPASGTPGQEQHFYQLPLVRQRQLLEVGLAVGAKILKNCDPGERSMSSLEGFGVPDHAHIVYYASRRGQGIDRFTGKTLGQEAVDKTIQLITFTPEEAEILEARLSLISQL